MINVLMLRYSGTWEHSYLPNAEVALKDLAKQSGLFNMVTTHQCERIKAEELAAIDVLVFATTGELPIDDAQKKALLDFVRSGKGFVGIHNATDTFHKWPEYGELTGGYFVGHPWNQEVWIKVEDGNHPATRHMGTGVRTVEEVYTFRNWERKKHRVLLSLDNASVDLSKGNRPDNDYALAWCHEYGKGRVMYTALGHHDEVWTVPWFRQHILGCLKWAARLED